MVFTLEGVIIRVLGGVFCRVVGPRVGMVGAVGMWGRGMMLGMHLMRMIRECLLLMMAVVAALNVYPTAALLLRVGGLRRTVGRRSGVVYGDINATKQSVSQTPSSSDIQSKKKRCINNARHDFFRALSLSTTRGRPRLFFSIDNAFSSNRSPETPNEIPSTLYRKQIKGKKGKSRLALVV